MKRSSKAKNHLLLQALGDKYPRKTRYLSQVFRNTTNSYKLVWFLAILSLLKYSTKNILKLQDIFIEMVGVVWHPVCLYRLSLGKQDKLQDIVLELKEKQNLAPETRTNTILETVRSSPGVLCRLNFLEKYVPTRFLTPWFADKLRGRKDREKDRLIKVLSKESQHSSSPSPYYFDEGNSAIIFNDSWLIFLIENIGIIQAFAEHHFALYLQRRNPNVPGIILKLQAPKKRQLTSARNYWRFVRKEFENNGWKNMFKDIYSQNPLNDKFSIDHFLPWSFVVHDLIWNLTPTEKSTNSKKGDMLPDLNTYIPHLAKLHYKAIEVSLRRPRLLEDYVTCFKEEPSTLVSLGHQNLEERYREIMVPLAQIASNQGFHAGWIYER